MAITFTPGQAVATPDWEALFAQHGGFKSVQNRRPTKDEQRAIEDAGGDLDQNPIYRYYLADGSYVEARTAANGADYEIVAYQPSQTFQQTQRQRDPESMTPSQQRTAREEAEIAANAALPPDQDPRPETNAERAARAERVIKEQGEAARREQAEAERKARENRPESVSTPANQPFIVERLPDGTLRTTKNPNYTGDKPEAGRTITVKGGDGKTYVVPINPDGTPGQPRDLGLPAERPPSTTRYNPDTGEYEEITRDAQGNPVVRTIPRAGQAQRPTTRAPSLPQIVVGESQNALRQAYDQIQAEVDSGRRTAAWGENRRKEVFEAAQLTVQEAQLHEQSRQYNQTQAYNLATFKASYGQDALGNAMKFTLSILDTLEPGSGSGGNFFKALFGLQMQMLRDSGIYGITPGGGQSSVGDPARRPPVAVPKPDINRPETIEAAASAARTSIEAVFKPPPPVPGSERVVPEFIDPRDGRFGIPPGRLGDGTPPAPPSPSATAATPPVRDDWRVTESGAPAPFNLDPAQGPVGMTPEAPRFAALESFRLGDTPPASQAVMARPEVPSNPADPAIMGAPLPRLRVELPSAVQRAQVAAMPPWRIPDDQIEDLVAQFGPETVFSVPGMRRSVGV